MTISYSKVLDSLSLGLILRSEFLSLSDHALDFFLAETTLLVGDSDTLRLATRRGNIVNRSRNPKKINKLTSAAPTFMMPLASISKVISI